MKIEKMSILKILKAVYFGEIPEGSGSVAKQVRRGHKIATLTSTIARRMYEAQYWLGERIMALEAVREVIGKTKINSPADNEAREAEISRLSERRSVLQSLMWMVVSEEHPMAITTALEIANGWNMYKAVGHCLECDVVVTDGRIKKLSSRIFDIVTSMKANQRAKFNLPILGPDEKVIGRTQDHRIFGLCWLLEATAKAADEILKTETHKLKGLHDSEMVEELVKLKIKQEYFQRLSATISALLWCIARDTVPEIAGTATPALRASGEIVMEEVSAMQIIKVVIEPTKGTANPRQGFWRN